MEMSVLSTEKAIRLYHLLEYHLPKVTPEMSAVSFIAQIVYNIRVTQQHRIYVDALALMQDTDIDTIMETYTPEESLNEFTHGLAENQILALRDFCTRVGI
jgi:hypothetical protein